MLAPVPRWRGTETATQAVSRGCRYATLAPPECAQKHIRPPASGGWEQVAAFVAYRSMPEMPRAGERHCDVMLKHGINHLVIAHRAAGLNDKANASFGGDFNIIGEG